MQDDREDKARVQDADNCLCRLKDIVKWYPPDRLVLDQFSLKWPGRTGHDQRKCRQRTDNPDQDFRSENKAQ